MKKCIVIMILSLLVVGTAAVSAQEPASEPVITLERTACFGTCPVYSVSIFADGTVNYNGTDFVSVTGEQTNQIDPATVSQMVEAMTESGYFEWDEAYQDQSVTDLATVTTSVTRDGETHQIVHYLGDFSAPVALSFLEQWIDDMAWTGMWTGVMADPSGISNGTDTPQITLQQTPCFGGCPVYTLALYADGTLVFSGLANVETIGVKVAQVDIASIEQIAQLAQIFGYFDWQDAYDKQVKTDQVTVISSIRWEDQAKRILRYGGDPSAPIGLVELESSIAALAA
ncbi:MAG: DUF6438 domain-containing protein, partial [Anaerolineae bacterium]|nr:DUF6438 domain-containing protein [Anaerolineae bacterium]